MPFQKKMAGGKLSRYWYVDRWVGGRPGGIHINKSTRTSDYAQACDIEEEWVAEAEEELVRREEGTPNDPQAITLSKALEWVSDNKWADNRTSSRPEMHIEEIIHILGRDPSIHELSGDQGAHLIGSIRKTLLNSKSSKTGHYRKRGKTTVNRYMASLRTLLRAMRDEYSIRSLQVPRIPMYKGDDAERSRDRALQPAEEIKLFGYMDRHQPEFAQLFKFLLDTGMRLGEALQLDYRKHVFLKRKQVTLGFGMRIKTDQRRSVPLTARAIKILEERRQSSFPKPFPWDESKCCREFRKARFEIGFEADDEFVPHMLRHTCITRLLYKGVPLSLVMTWAGHTSAQTTKRYTNFVAADLEMGATVLDTVNDAIERFRIESQGKELDLDDADGLEGISRSISKKPERIDYAREYLTATQQLTVE